MTIQEKEKVIKERNPQGSELLNMAFWRFKDKEYAEYVEMLFQAVLSPLEKALN